MNYNEFIRSVRCDGASDFTRLAYGLCKEAGCPKDTLGKMSPKECWEWLEDHTGITSDSASDAFSKGGRAVAAGLVDVAKKAAKTGKKATADDIAEAVSKVGGKAPKKAPAPKPTAKPAKIPPKPKAPDPAKTEPEKKTEEKPKTPDDLEKKSPIEETKTTEPEKTPEPPKELEKPEKLKAPKIEYDMSRFSDVDILNPDNIEKLKDTKLFSIDGENFERVGDKMLVSSLETGEIRGEDLDPMDAARVLKGTLKKLDKGAVIQTQIDGKTETYTSFGNGRFQPSDGSWVGSEDLTTQIATSGGTLITDPKKFKAGEATHKWDRDNGITPYTKPIDESRFTEERKNNAVWFKTDTEADDYFRPQTEEVWSDATLIERTAATRWTEGAGTYTRQARGEPSYGKPTSPKSQVEALHKYIERSPLKDDTWLQRGEEFGLLANQLGVDPELFNQPDDVVRAEIIGRIGHDNAPLATSTVKGLGYSDKNVIMNVYCPKGTRGAYVEPLSHYGDTSEPMWDGTSKKPLREQMEVIIQRGSNFRVTRYEKVTSPWSKPKIYVDIEILDTDDIQPVSWPMHYATLR